MPLLDAWLRVDGLSKIQRLRLIDSIITYRPELLGELETIVLSATDPDGAEWGEDRLVAISSG
jgi:hypothetical protein